MPGVKGTFEVDNRASGPLRDMRSDAQSTKQAFRELGAELDKVGANTTNLDKYKRSLSDMRDSGVRSLSELGDQWDRTAARTDRSIAVMKGGMDDLQVKMKEVSDTHMTPTIDVRGIDESLAKIALLKAELRNLSTDTANPRVSVGGGMSGFGGGGATTASSFSGPLSAASSDASGLGAAIPSLAIKAAAALPIIQSLTGATVSLISTMTGAAVGTGAVGIAGGGALAVGLSSIIAVAKPAISSIENVFKAESSLTKAREQAIMPGQQQTQQLHQVVQAENQLQQAQVQSRMAQIALTEARRTARNELTNLGLAAQGAALGEKQAAITLAGAQRSLYETETSPTSQPLQIQQAELQVRQARLGVSQSHQQDKEAGEALRIGRRQGVKGNPQVMSAENSAQQSKFAIQSARWAEEEARRNSSGGGSSVESARLAYNAALAKAPPGTKELLAAGRSFIHEWKSATSSASRDFIGILTGTVGTLHAMMPTLAGASNRDMKALRSSGEDFGTWLRSPQNQGFITTGSKMFAENLGNAEESVTHIFGTLENITVAARPFLHEATTAFDHWTGSWDSGTANVTKTRAEIGRMVQDAKDWTHMWESGWKLMHDIAEVGGASSQGNSMIGTFTKTMDRWDEWVKQNPDKVRAFFRETREGAEGLASAVGKIAGSLNSVATQLQPLMKGGLGILGLLNSTGLTSSIGGLGGLYGVYRGGRSALGGNRGGGGTVGGAAGGRGVASLGAAAASGLFMLGGRSSGEIVGNVRTMPNVASARAGGGFVVSSGTGRAVSADARAIEANAAAAAGSPFISIAQAEGAGAGKWGGRGMLGSGLSRLGKAATSGARIAAPYVALNDVLSIAGGGNPFKGSSPVSGILGGAGQGAVMGAALGSVVPVLGTGAGALVGGAAGAIAGVASNAGALHRDIFGASSSEKAVEGYEHMEKAIQSVGGRLNELNPQQLAKLNSEAVKLEKNSSPALKGVRMELLEIAKASNKAAQATSGWSHQYGGAVSAMASASHRSLGEVANVAQTTAEGIQQELGSGSAKAREMLSRNFAAAAQAVEQRMRETGKFTHEGVEIVNKELSKALGEYGIKVPKGVKSSQKMEALKAAQEGAKGVQFNKAGGVSETGRATGGRLAGMGAYDTVRMGDGGYGAPGELVVNRHTEALANLGLARAGMPPLGSMVARTTIPHSTPLRATGGYTFIPDSGTNFSVGQEPQIVSDLRLLAQRMHEDIYGISGYRTPQHSVEVGGFANDPHTRGEAADIGVGSPSLASAAALNAALLASVGLDRPFYPASAHEINHVQLLAGGPRGNLAGMSSVRAGRAGANSSTGVAPAALNLGVPQIGGTGLPGQFANAGLASYTQSLAKKYGGPVATSSSAIGGGANYSSVPGQGGSAAANERLGKAMMLADGWPASQWPSLQKLWTHESGWSATAMNNPSAGWLAAGNASGIPQSDGHGQVYRYGDARGQIAWGLNYIKQQYGSPSKAWAFEMSHTPNWYEHGGRLGGHSGVPFIGGYKNGGSFTTRPGQPVAFVAGEGSHVEDVHIAPRKGAAQHAPGAANPTIKVEINIGDVTVPDVKDLKKVIDEASDEAARKLLAAFERLHDRKVGGTVID